MDDLPTQAGAKQLLNKSHLETIIVLALRTTRIE